MSKRRKPLKDLSVKQLKRVALEEAQHDLSLLSDSDSELSSSDFEHLSDSENESTVNNSNVQVIRPSDNESVKKLSESSYCSSSPNCYLSSSETCSSLSSPLLEVNDMHSLPTSSEYCKSSECSRNDLLKEDLANWAVSNKITNHALSQLLKLLSSHGHTNLPSDARALLNTPRSTLIRDVPPGIYWHAGIKDNISETYIGKQISSDPEIKCIELAIGIDGLPIAKSSGSCLWPILGKVINVTGDNTFVIGVYHGNEKPFNANEYLKDFIDETVELSQTGIVIEHKLYKIVIKYIICDAPAKAFILNVKSHSGYNSCTKCTIQGQYLNGRVCFFDDKHSNNRTDSEYFEINDDDFHLGGTDLKKIPGLGLVTNVPLDYMHLVCLGVTRKLIYLWVFGDKRMKKRKQLFKIGKKSEIDNISSFLENIRLYVPVEFSRKPRSLKEVKMWKATEYRQILLYTGVVVFKNVLPEVIYQHFVTLHLGIRIICSPDLSSTLIQYARQLLQHFVKTFSVIYGKHNVTHNVHGLTHLVDDVEKFGNLDNFSAFSFENEMQIIKKKLRKSEKPLQQLCRRYFEEKKLLASHCQHQPSLISIDEKSLHYVGPLVQNTTNPQYKVLYVKKCKVISGSRADSCCQLNDGTIVSVFNIAFNLLSKEHVIIGKEFHECNDKLFIKPCHSSFFDIKVITGPSNYLKMWPLQEIKCKVFMLPFEDKHVTIPILHNSY